jgi:hypothetical protein
LIAADGSIHTKRMLGFIAAHEEWLGPQHSYSVLHGVPAIPHRAATFMDKAQVQAFYSEDAQSVFKPIRTFFKRHPVATKVVSLCRAPVRLVRWARRWHRRARRKRCDTLNFRARGASDLSAPRWPQVLALLARQAVLPEREV